MITTFELMQKILSLPTSLPLSEDNLTTLIDMMYQSHVKDSLFLKQELKNKTSLSQKTIDVLTAYFIQVNELITMLNDWNQQLAHIWREKIPTRILSNDELLPLTIELLPSSRDQLERNIISINFAMKFFEKEPSFCLTNFLVACMVKIHLILAPLSQDIPLNECDISSVALEIKAQEKIACFKQACNQYKIDLFLRFKGILQKKKDCALPYYFDEKKSNDEIMLEIAKDIRNELNEQPVLPKAPLLTIILEKYLVAFDMFDTLNRDELNTEEKITELYTKLSNHADILCRNSDAIDIKFLDIVDPENNLKKTSSLNKNSFAYDLINQMKQKMFPSYHPTKKQDHEPLLNSPALK